MLVQTISSEELAIYLVGVGPMDQQVIQCILAFCYSIYFHLFYGQSMASKASNGTAINELIPILSDNKDRKLRSRFRRGLPPLPVRNLLFCVKLCNILGIRRLLFCYCRPLMFTWISLYSHHITSYAVISFISVSFDMH